jgi:hypothetical protein
LVEESSSIGHSSGNMDSTKVGAGFRGEASGHMIRLTDWACPIPTGNLLNNSIRLLEGITDGLARETPSVKPTEATEAWGRQLAPGNMEARPGCRAARVTEVAFRRVQRGTSSRPSAINRGRRTRRRLELLPQDLAALVEATAEGPLAAVLAADSAVVVSVADPRAAVLAAEATVSEVAAVAAAGDDRAGVASDEPAHVKLDPLG